MFNKSISQITPIVFSLLFIVFLLVPSQAHAIPTVRGEVKTITNAPVFIETNMPQMIWQYLCGTWSEQCEPPNGDKQSCHNDDVSCQPASRADAIWESTTTTGGEFKFLPANQLIPPLYGFGCLETGHTITGIGGTQAYPGTFSKEKFLIKNNIDTDLIINAIIYTPPPQVIAGCFYSNNNGNQISSGPFPRIEVCLDTGTCKTPSLDAQGCWSIPNFVNTSQMYAVRADLAIAPFSYNPPAKPYNNSAVAFYPEGSRPVTQEDSSFEYQMAGNSDCGEECNFAFDPTPVGPAIPDCTNLTGPTSLLPGATGTYELTSDDSNAPVTSVEVSAYGTQCTDSAKPYSPKQVSGPGTYSFDWKAPSNPGVYTLYGRVWNNDISECRSDCVDGPPRYLCASAAQCKLQVVVGTPAPSIPKATCSADGTSATIQWNAVPGAKRYILRIDQVNECGLPVGDWFCGEGQGFPENSGDQYLFVRAADVCTADKCSTSRPVVPNTLYRTASIQWVETESGEVVPMPERIGDSASFTCHDPASQVVTIKGTVREGSVTAQANQICSAPSLPAKSITGRVTLGDNEEQLNNASTYSFPIPLGSAGSTRTLQLYIAGSTGYMCSCKTSSGANTCTYSVPTDTVGEFTYDFFISPFTDKSWWQAAGGTVFAKTQLATAIPATCTEPNCEPYLVQQEKHAAITNPIIASASIPLTGNTSISTLDGNKTARDGNPSAVGVADSAPQENYAYFAGLLSPETAAQNLGSTFPGITSLEVLTGNKKIGDTEVYYVPGSLQIAPDDTLQITGRRKVVIFVTGDVTISGPRSASPTSPKPVVLVERGSFFMVIAQGSTTISATVGAPPEENMVSLEGVYLSDITLKIQTDENDSKQDLRFIGAGTFAGRGGVVLERQFKDGSGGEIANNTYATEQFIFRPDFISSFPEALKDSQTTWREVR